MRTEISTPVDVVARVVAVRPWPDPVIDRLGYDPRSPYVEQFWLPTLGPSACWLLRRLAAGLEAHPEGYELDLEETARAIGLGRRGGHNSPFARTLGRCAQFHLVHHDLRRGLVMARRKLPPLNRHQVGRLTDGMQAEHRRWIERPRGSTSDDRSEERAQRLALSLLDLGESPAETEAQLIRWRFPTHLCQAAIAWAVTRRGPA